MPCVALPSAATYHFSKLIRSMSMCVSRRGDHRMMARPTATSAAATVMTNSVKTCPWPGPARPYRGEGDEVDVDALSMSSTHMRIRIALRCVRAP